MTCFVDAVKLAADNTAWRLLRTTPLLRLFILALRQRICLFKISDKIGSFLRVGDPRITHGGARHRSHGIGQEHVQAFFVPDYPGVRHGFGIVEIGHCAGLAPKKTAMPRAGPIVGQRVASKTARINSLAPTRIAHDHGLRPRRRRRHHRHKPGATGRQRHLPYTPDHDMNATGTGGSPRALRKIAQCMASSPRMLAAAFARSRLSKTGTAPRYALTAPFSSIEAKRKTSV